MSAFPSVRRIKKEDFAEASKLHARCFSEKQYWSQACFDKYFSKETVFGFVSICDAQIAAVVVLQKTDEVAEILTLSVDPDKRRKNIGYQLMLCALEWVEESGIKEIFLDVAVDNEAAILLYKKLGFREIALRENYYVRATNKVNAYVLKKHIIATAAKDHYSVD